jgi:hypothetical protein
VKAIIVTNDFYYTNTANAARVKSMVKCFTEAQVEVLVIQQIDICNPNYQPQKDNYKHNKLKVLLLNLNSGLQGTIASNMQNNKLYRLASWLYFVINKAAAGYNLIPLLNDLLHAYNINDNDIVICTAPNTATFKVGHHLHKKYGCKWIADYRDVLTTHSGRVRKTHFSRQLHDLIMQYYEHKWVATCALITTVTQSMAVQLIKQHQKPLHVIANGYDDEIEGFNFDQELDKCLNITYLGSKYINQNDDIFWEAINQLYAQQPETKILINYIGATPNKDKISDGVAQHWLIVKPRAAIESITPILAQSHVLLHFGLKNARDMATAKIYTYLKACKPIWYINPYEGELYDLIEGNHAGLYSHSIQETSLVLAKILNDYAQKKRFYLAHNGPKVLAYARELQSKEMLKLALAL